MLRLYEVLVPLFKWSQTNVIFFNWLTLQNFACFVCEHGTKVKIELPIANFAVFVFSLTPVKSM